MILSLRGFDVRPAEKNDIDRIVELDRNRFGGKGVVPFDERHVRCWMDINPSGVLVATHGGEVVAYRYSQYLDFSLDDIGRLTTCDAFTDGGYTAATHNPNGNSINGVTVCSDKSGAGRVLFEIIFRQLVEQRRRYYFGFARIPDFDAYRCKVIDAGLPAGCTEYDLATAYVHAIAAQVNGLIWPWVPKPQVEGIPPPDGEDRVLSKYLRHQGFGVAAIQPNWMTDPNSRDFGVMVLYKNPEIPGL